MAAEPAGPADPGSRCPPGRHAARTTNHDDDVTNEVTRSNAGVPIPPPPRRQSDRTQLEPAAAGPLALADEGVAGAGGGEDPDPGGVAANERDAAGAGISPRLLPGAAAGLGAARRRTRGDA
ncbi:unnamed protein product [Lampetra planeri]